MVKRGGLASQSQRTIRESMRIERAPTSRARAEQDGTRLSVTVAHLCQPVGERRVERTQHYGREIGSPNTLGLFGAVGAGAGLLGALLVTNVFGLPPMDSMGASDSGLSAETGLYGGIGLLALAAGLVTVTLANLVGLVGTDDEVTEETVPMGAQGPAGPCAPPQPFSGAVVRLGERSGGLELGRTDSSGTLQVDVSRLAEPRFVYEHSQTSLGIHVAGRRIDAVFDLAPLRLQLDERLWARAYPARCVAAQEAVDCGGVARYLQLFPAGLHLDEAREIHRRALARLAERAALLEARRRAEEARRAADEERQRAEAEQRRRQEEERWEREQRAAEQRRRAEEERRERERRVADQAAAAARARTATERERRAARATCRRDCVGTCGGTGACVDACVREQCR